MSAALAAVVLSFGASLPANADSGGGKVASGTFIPGALLSQAQADPDASFKVIVQGDGSTDADHLANKIGAWAAHADQKLADAAAKAADNLAKAQADAAKQKSVVAEAKAALAVAAAQSALDQANGAFGPAGDQITRDQVKDEFSSINGVAVTLTGRQLTQVYAHGNEGLLSITPDALAHVSGVGVPANGANKVSWSNYQPWPYVAGAAGNWSGDANTDIAANEPAIAVVDTGVEARSELFGSRVIASVNLSTLPNNSSGDGRGHGTFVAGMAAASLKGLSGAAPNTPLVSIDVMDDQGAGLTSDIINACQWILDHKAQYNIKVANFSLQSDITAPFFIDPLDRAVEKLWFSGITVVVAAGNYGSATGPTGVLYSPSNDPFVITVGAADLLGTTTTADDTIAPWSAWGHTIDGFAKPELSAPGRYLVGPVSSNATLAIERPASVVYPGYMQLSGTSFAAPVVSGAAADILARHPDWTPDQVKGALMVTARTMSPAVGASSGVGELTADAAANVTAPPNPNLALDAFVNSSAFDSASWIGTAQTNASWNSASWNSVSWNSASWNSASWNSVSWNSASWNSASWNSASWNSVSWNDVSWNSASHEDAAGGDSTPDPSLYTLTSRDIADLLIDPNVAASYPSWMTVPTKPSTGKKTP